MWGLSVGRAGNGIVLQLCEALCQLFYIKRILVLLLSAAVIQREKRVK